MAGVDPISLAIIGAGVGAVASPKDPIRGAIMGGALGFGGGALAAPSAAAGTGITAPAIAGSEISLLGPMKATEMGLGSGIKAVAAGSGGATTPFALSSVAPLAAPAGITLGSGILPSGAAVTAPQALTAQQKMQLAGRGLQMAQSRQTAPQTVGQGAFRGGREIASTEPILSLLATAQPRRRQPMSLL